MDRMTQAPPQPEAMLAWMECLADPTRLRLLRLLERHELGVAELCDVLQSPQSSVSRHLKVLSDQGWVRSRRQGTNNLYRTVLDELEPAARRLWVLAREQTAPWATARQDEQRLAQLLRDKQTDSQAFFATAAARWDRLRDELYGRSFARSAMLALLPSDWVVADLACGTGQVTAEIANCVRKVIAVDNSAAMLKAARRRTAELPNVDLRRGDLETLPIEAGECDAALLLLALTYVPDPAAVVKEMSRILKPGGRAVVVDLQPHDREDFRVEMGQQHRGIDPSELEQMMRESGFAQTSTRSIPPEPNIKGPALFLTTGTTNN
jgi:SAM-dependent methyltransferase